MLPTGAERHSTARGGTAFQLVPVLKRLTRRVTHGDQARTYDQHREIVKSKRAERDVGPWQDSGETME